MIRLSRQELSVAIGMGKIGKRLCGGVGVPLKTGDDDDENENEIES